MPEKTEISTAAALPAPLSEIFRHIVDRAGAKMVYGDPVTAAGRTIVPVAKIRYGFGSGSGKREDGQRHGGGGGGGLVAKPVGVVEITESATRFLRFAPGWMPLAAVAIGVALGYLLAPRTVQVKVDKTGRA
jgi:uncharacterized spore protein YtfJ